MTRWADTDTGRPSPDRDARPSLVLGHGWTELLKQIALVLTGALFYFAVRGLTEGTPAEAIRRGEQILRLEARVGIDIEKRAQELITDSEMLVTLSNWVYIWLHWPVIIVTLFWLHRTRRFDYLILRNAMFASGAIGLVIFALYPVAPPRLTNAGFVDTVTELSSSYRVLQPPALVNKYAAVPSLHVGWNLLVGVIVFTATRRRLIRLAAALCPIAMTIAVVLTANHYVLDALIGAFVAAVGLMISLWLTPEIVRTEPAPPDRDVDRAVALPGDSAIPNRHGTCVNNGYSPRSGRTPTDPGDESKPKESAEQCAQRSGRSTLWSR